MTVDIQPLLGGARVVEDASFQFCCLGNFSGSAEEREVYTMRPVNRNTWDGLFAELSPAIQATISLPGVSDFTQRIAFKSLSDFGEKGLTAQVPLLNSLHAMRAAVRRASEDEPLDVAALLAEHPQLNLIKTMAENYSEGEALDLLNMVDLGDDEGSDGPILKYTKAVFAAERYSGGKREAAGHELDGLAADVLGQITALTAFAELESHWRGLKALFGMLKKRVKLAIIDCGKDELCDATFLTFVKPLSGARPKIDMLMTAFDFDRSEDDLHILLHLGKMAESLTVPYLMNVAPSLFGARSYKTLQHITDYSSRLAGPEFAKWRKHRDEPGSRWIFMCINQFATASGQQEDACWVAGAFVFACVMAQSLENDTWPGELMGPQGKLDEFGHSRMVMSENQAHDLGFEGFCSFSSHAGHQDIFVLGMNCFAAVKIGIGHSPSARDFVEYTLSYAFFVGCLSRYLLEIAGDSEVREKLMDYIGSQDQEDVVLEEDEDGQHFYRVKPMMTIFNQRPDVVLGVD